MANVSTKYIPVMDDEETAGSGSTPAEAPSSVAVTDESWRESASGIAQHFYGENPPDASLEDALNSLATKGLPKANYAPWAEMSSDAANTQNQLQLSANLVQGLGRIAQGISGGDESTAPSAQEYQNKISASYTPRKYVEQQQSLMANELEITSQRREAEMSDPTSPINREFQKKLAPSMEAWKVPGMTPWMTIKDAMQPGGLTHAFLNAKRRSNEQAQAALAQAAMSDLEHHRAMALTNAKLTASKDIALIKKGPRGVGGGGGGSLQARKDALRASYRSSGVDYTPELDAQIQNLDEKGVKAWEGKVEGLLTKGSEPVKPEQATKMLNDYTAVNRETARVVAPIAELTHILAQEGITSNAQFIAAKKLGKLGAVSGKKERIVSLIAEIKALLTKDISGAAVTEGEVRRLAAAYALGDFSGIANFRSTANRLLGEAHLNLKQRWENMPKDVRGAYTGRHVFEQFGLPQASKQYQSQQWVGGADSGGVSPQAKKGPVTVYVDGKPYAKYPVGQFNVKNFNAFAAEQQKLGKKVSFK